MRACLVLLGGHPIFKETTLLHNGIHGCRSKIQLVVQDYVEKATVYCQPMAVVIDESKPFELVHEMADA